MLLFGHHFIKSEKFYHINDIDAVTKTPSNAIIYVEFNENNLDIITFLQLNSIRFALHVNSLTEAIYAYNLGAKYITCNEKLAVELQKTAETYLFDAKILVHIDEEKEIEKYAKVGIDGVVFPTAIIKVSL
ncbi:MAG: hypothetical protein GXO11_00850 [Epsilonproteobacteria bacterium]|nr:hypothetical protein [Campylobacterota bacterium]